MTPLLRKALDKLAEQGISKLKAGSDKVGVFEWLKKEAGKIKTEHESKD